jgi:hypothetical protein
MITKQKRRSPAWKTPLPFGCPAAPSGSQRVRAFRDNLVDQAVVLGLVGRQEVVALGVALDLLQRLAGAFGQDLVQDWPWSSGCRGVDLDVGRLALHAAQRLVDHDLRVGQREALALLAGRQQEGAHAGRHAGAQVDTAGLMKFMVS